MNLGVISVIYWMSVGSMIYTYFGYPVMIMLLALFHSEKNSYKEFLPPITLLIAAFNEESVIEAKIKNSLLIDYPKDRYQILIVTDGSSDHTPEIVHEYQKHGVKLLHQPERRGKMAAIIRAMPSASGEIIVFSDANNFYQPDTLKKLVAPFSNPNIGGVSGSKIIEKGDGSLGESEGLYWKYESFIKKMESRLGSCTSAVGEILAIRKDKFIAPPSHIINDDFYIAMQIIRQGSRFIYVPEAQSSERVSPTAKDEITRRTRINAGRFQTITLAHQILPFNQPIIVWQVISHKFMRPLVSFFMIGAAVSNLSAVLFPPVSNSFFNLGKPYGAILLVLQTLFYLSAFVGAQLMKRNKQTGFARILYIPTFLTNSNFAALKGFVHFLRGGQSHIWERIQRR